MPAPAFARAGSSGVKNSNCRELCLWIPADAGMNGGYLPAFAPLSVRPRESGDPEKLLSVVRARNLSPEVMPLRILSLDQTKLPRSIPLFEPPLAQQCGLP